MASDLISRDALLDSLRESCEGLRKIYEGLQFDDELNICSGQITTFIEAILRVKEAPAVEAIPIDDVAEMLAALFGDEIPCNYNDIDEILSIGCEKAHCPDDGDHSCWKKYVKAWMERKGKDAQV